MRGWRPKDSELPPEAKKKAYCRAYTKSYQKRGYLPKGPCEVCGGPAENHHEDYDKPLVVKRLCREHHLALHDR